jgi:nitrate/nitrite transporter NarK
LAAGGHFGLAGWQWLFIVEGLPSVILGFAALFWLANSPDEVRWLSQAEKRWLRETIAREQDHNGDHGFAAGLTGARVWLMALLYFMIVSGVYGVGLWLPQIIKGLGALSNVQVGLVSAIPFLAAAAAMVEVGRSSDRRGERRWHLAFSAFAGAAGLLLSAHSHHPLIALSALSLAAAGIWGTMGPFWSMPSEYLGGTAAAVGIALINSVGNLGGFAGPYLVGMLKQISHSFSGGLCAMAVMLAAAGCLALALPQTAATARPGRTDRVANMPF